MKRRMTLLLTLLILLALPATALAATSAKSSTLKLTDYRGTVTVTESSGKSVSVSKGLRLYSGCTIATKANSEAAVKLDNSKYVRMAASSKASIQSSGNKLQITLVSGTMYCNVSQALSAGESMNVRNSNMVAGIRGTDVWMTENAFGVLTGSTECTFTNLITGKTVRATVSAGEQVVFAPGSPEPGKDLNLKQNDFIKTDTTNESLPVFVKGVILDTPQLADAVDALPGIDVGRMRDEYPQDLQNEQERLKRLADELLSKRKEQEKIIIDSATSGNQDYYFDNGTSSGGGGGGGGGHPTQYAVVTYYANDGTESKTSQSIPVGTPSALAANPFTYLGHAFTGWNTHANGNGVPFTDGQNVTLSGNLDLYAQWTADPATYTLEVTDLAFDVETVGYAQPAAKALTITSTGNSDATISSVALSGTNAESFTLTNGTASVTAGGTNTTYTVRPNAGLGAGIYEATVTVTYNNDATTTADVSFTVYDDAVIVTNSDELINALIDDEVSKIKVYAQDPVPLNDSDGYMVSAGKTLILACDVNLGSNGNPTILDNYGTVINNGKLTVENATLTNRAGAAFNNAGTLNLYYGGVLENAGSLTNTGTIEIEKDDYPGYQVDGGKLNNDYGGTVQNDGIIEQARNYENYLQVTNEDPTYIVVGFDSGTGKWSADGDTNMVRIIFETDGTVQPPASSPTRGGEPCSGWSSAYDDIVEVDWDSLVGGEVIYAVYPDMP